MAPKIILDPVPKNSEGHPKAFERTIAFNTRKLKAALLEIEKELERIDEEESNSH
jgi:hypothetical protein